MRFGAMDALVIECTVSCRSLGSSLAPRVSPPTRSLELFRPSRRIWILGSRGTAGTKRGEFPAGAGVSVLLFIRDGARGRGLGPLEPTARQVLFVSDKLAERTQFRRSGFEAIPWSITGCGVSARG